MRPALLKGLCLGILTGIAGLIAGLLPFGAGAEKDAGLDLLFWLRGPVQPPSGAVVVSIDKESSSVFDLSENPDKWPRSLHARLIENLAREGAAVIAFDVHFVEPRSAEEDRLLAEAMRKAGNVVLCEPLQAREIPFGDKENELADVHRVVKIVKPLDLFAHSAAATTPFILPRIPFKVSHYWTFQPGAGDSPSMPAVALYLYTLQAYEPFVRLLEAASPAAAGKFPRDREAAGRDVTSLMMGIHEVFQGDPALADRLLAQLERPGSSPGDAGKQRMLKALIEMYRGAGLRYVNFYGPPRTIPTISFHQALQLNGGVAGGRKFDVRGKVVFVGLSEVLLAERKDSFYTVFSEADGLFLSGVEIAATAFSNLLEDKPVVPVGLSWLILLLFLWGLLMGISSRVPPLPAASLGVIGAVLLYVFLAAHQFKAHHTWFPIIVPVLVQTPLAFFGAVTWNYVDTNKERRNIKKAFEHYLPKDMVNKLARNVTHVQAGGEVVYGICLFTDAENYTAMAETMPPADLGRFMNRYYETMFRPVKLYDGCVSGVIGDAMLALWVTTRSEKALKEKACRAALDIWKNERELMSHGADNVSHVRLRTRIGLHCGHILLGSVGALDHYEYTPMGDIVNTASRIESLNKQLGTTLMVSDELIRELDGFVSRELGAFKLKGKLNPVRVHELLGRAEEAGAALLDSCALFADALAAFRARSWDEAIGRFQRILDRIEDDGPSRFYIGQCQYFKSYPPEEQWNGLIRLDRK